MNGIRAKVLCYILADEGLLFCYYVAAFFLDKNRNTTPLARQGIKQAKPCALRRGKIGWQLLNSTAKGAKYAKIIWLAKL
ncbi:MAG: hypothetical protein MJZ99_09200 [Bacteroidales bacterium]|nr:hypothetical protein [Bacteroidales bacterium]